MIRYGSLINSKYRFDNSLIYIIISLVTFSTLITVTLVGHIYIGSHQLTPHGAVSSDVDVCSKIGVDQLKKGGSAIDATISTLFCLGVINSAHSGIGGGGFMLIYSHLKNETFAIDFRETLPLGVDDPFKNKASAIGIPGEVKGMYLSYKMFGKLPWKTLVEPAIELAQNGYVMTEATILAIHKKFDSPEQMEMDYPLLAKIYLKYENRSDGSTNLLPRFIKVGEMTRNPALAETLKAIAEPNVKALYEGPIARDLVQTVNNHDGSMSLDELYAYQPVIREPIYFTFMRERYTGISFPPPGSGSRLALVLELLEKLGVPDLLQDNSNVIRYYGRYKKDFNSVSNQNEYAPIYEKILDLQEKMHLHKTTFSQSHDPSHINLGVSKEHSTASRFYDSHQRYFKNLDPKFTALYYHWLIEALKIGQAYASNIRDPTIAVLGANFFNNNSTPLAENQAPPKTTTPDSSSNNPKILNQQPLLSSNSNSKLFGYSQDESIPTPDIPALLALVSNVTARVYEPRDVPLLNSPYQFGRQDSVPVNKVGTAHVSVVDNDELYVSVTSTLNNLFGSKIMTKHGILLNDEMNDFAKPGQNEFSRNLPEHGKRPYSNMVPTIIYETDKPCGLRLVIGGSNSSRIPSGIIQVLLNILAFEDSLETAMARPRLYPNTEIDMIEVESNFPEEIISQLQKKNHRILKVNEGLNSVIPVMKIRDSILATSDPRKSPKQSAAAY